VRTVSEYHLDLSKLSLDWLRGKIESHELVPARRVLQDRIVERFAALRNAGIATVADLVSALKTRERMKAFADRTGLPDDHLVWLGREARSYKPNPFALRDIRNVDPELIDRLEGEGIKTTKALFDRAATKVERRRLAKAAGVPERSLTDLVKLADLARIRGMGKTFVRLFTAAGADSVAALVKMRPHELHKRLYAVNKGRKLSSVVPSLKDVSEYVEMARELPKVLEI
jgi:hypothetical protein